ncbi:NADP-dependent 3-hydroxy acid dehydrogenase YdfG [Desulfuromusa kysingii]|uniref:NADP-dependent 3-hydroxy acid dehydrogenase YdfG n=1 Tax=Desulfuromusa kysingii TaxID=37625 RepID=A0A1H4AXP6_9BACT|nr:SDR family oxidoreductase [Desulfuromusa kysingii]SEA40604.1 NADP-dependent 3-hydroxy acid dehydrogenase YdfG [Desulfuromusa kysingii]
MKKTILITGATSGFGKACAEHFAVQGWQLILTGRRTGRLEQLQQQLGEAVLTTMTLDVRDREQVFAKLGSLTDVDVLLNNAGLALGLEPSWAVDIDDWETMVDTNIKGLMYCTRALLPQMVSRDSGHIVNIGSTAGSWPYPGGNVYGGTKAFVKQFSRNLRSDLLGSKVRVTNVAPGMAESEFSNVRFKGDIEQAAKVYQGTEALRPEDIAETVFWIVNRPAHVNINVIEMMPVDQAWGPFAIHRHDK